MIEKIVKIILYILILPLLIGCHTSISNLDSTNVRFSVSDIDRSGVSPDWFIIHDNKTKQEILVIYNPNCIQCLKLNSEINKVENDNINNSF